MLLKHGISLCYTHTLHCVAFQVLSHLVYSGGEGVLDIILLRLQYRYTLCAHNLLTAAIYGADCCVRSY